MTWSKRWEYVGLKREGNDVFKDGESDGARLADTGKKDGKPGSLGATMWDSHEIDAKVQEFLRRYGVGYLFSSRLKVQSWMSHTVTR